MGRGQHDARIWAGRRRPHVVGMADKGFDLMQQSQIDKRRYDRAQQRLADAVLDRNTFRNNDCVVPERVEREYWAAKQALELLER